MTGDGGYVRDYYKVPATVGGRVRFGRTLLAEGARLGTIVGFHGAYVLVRMDGDSHANPLHPTWDLEYLTEGTP